MRRNSTTIFISTMNATTPLPWNGVEPLFTRINEPTLSVLTEAWNNGKNNIEIIPDPEPIADLLPEPNWQGFGFTLMALPSYSRMINAATNQRVVNRLEALASGLSTAGDNPGTYLILSQLWASFLDSVPLLLKLTVSEIEELNVIAQQFNMKFSFSVDGLLVLN